MPAINSLIIMLVVTTQHVRQSGSKPALFMLSSSSLSFPF